MVLREGDAPQVFMQWMEQLPARELTRGHKTTGGGDNRWECDQTADGKAGEGLLRDITQVHCDIKNRTSVVRNSTAASNRRRWRM